jgi:putative restriction endonuclease
MKAVLTTRPGSGYDDIVEERYHFPATYLAQVENAVGDLIVYYAPRRTAPNQSGGRQAYFAVARVASVERDPKRDDHYYANISDYLDFDNDVPFRTDAGDYFESILQRDDGETNRGAFGRSVRNVPDREFDAILTAGFLRETLYPPSESIHGVTGLDEPPTDYVRPVAELTVTKKIRDRAFALHVQSAYDRTCAITGLQIINGGGRPEVQAAHIQPVAANGPDSIRNGIALSGTLHWMFDRGLVSIGQDYEILTVDSGIPDPVRRLMHPSGRLLRPANEAAWPLQHYLDFHRRNVFKGSIP